MRRAGLKRGLKESFHQEGPRFRERFYKLRVAEEASVNQTVVARRDTIRSKPRVPWRGTCAAASGGPPSGRPDACRKPAKSSCDPNNDMQKHLLGCYHLYTVGASHSDTYTFSSSQGAGWQQLCSLHVTEAIDKFPSASPGT